MKKQQIFTEEHDGFIGAYYGGPADSKKAIILMLGDSSEDHMARCGADWVMKRGCHALNMSAGKKDYGHHNYPLERFGKAISFLRSRGIEKIGIAGASTTGMLALIAASYYPDITLTIAMSPSDFVMEGFYRDGKDGMMERPGDNESTVSWQGKPLPYLPFAYRHPEYWQKIMEESKAGGDKVASRKMFDESERLHPVREEEKIKVEKIHGKIVFVGAEDEDVLKEEMFGCHPCENTSSIRFKTRDLMEKILLLGRNENNNRRQSRVIIWKDINCLYRKKTCWNA